MNHNQKIILFLCIIHYIRAHPSSLTLGFLGPLNLPNVDSQVAGHPALLAFKLAIRDINNRSDLLPNTTLTFVRNNTNSDVGDATIEAFWQCVHGNVIGIVGEYVSAVSQSVQYVSRYYKVPQISYGSTSSEFTELHSTKFPYFLRTIPDQSSQSVLLAHLVVSQGWYNIGLIYTTNTQVFHITQIFLEEARKLKITILVSTSFAPDTRNISTQIMTIKESQARIIVFIGTTKDQLIIIDNCLAHGLTGPEYQWISMHPSMHRGLYLNSTYGINTVYYDWLQGFIGLYIHVDANSSMSKRFNDSWSTVPNDPETPTVDSHYISPIASFAYDACMMFAYALHYMIEVLDMDPTKMENRDLYLQVLQNITFDGVSGHVSVDQNGDRPANGFDIVNFQGDQLVQIGTISTDGQVTYLPDVEIMYMGRTYIKPRDLPIRPVIEIHYSTAIGIIVGSAVCGILCIAFMIFTCCCRKHAVMKASSPTFLVLMLIGVLSLATSVIPRALETYHPSSWICLSEFWLSNTGYPLIIGTLLLKTYRLWRIFRMSQATVKYHLKTPSLLMILLGLMIVSSAMLIGICVGDPFYIQRSPFNSTSDYQYCASEYKLSVKVPLILSTRFALLLLTTICAFKIRKLPDLYNETRQLVFTVYNLSFLSVAVPIIDLTMERGKTVETIAHGLAILVICILTTLIMFGPKLILVLNMGQRRKCSSLTFVFNRNSASPLKHPDSHPGGVVEQQQERHGESHSTIRIRETSRTSEQNDLHRSCSSP